MMKIFRLLFLLVKFSQFLIISKGNILNEDELNSLFDDIHERRTQEKLKNDESELEKALGSTVNLNFHFRNPHKIPTPIQPNLMNNLKKFTPLSAKISDFAETGIEVAQLLMSKRLKNVSEPLKELNILKAPSKFCPFKGEIICDPTFPYRKLDGTCNNLNNLWWGRKEIPYKRLLKPDYADDINEPRSAFDGSELPNPRELACALHSDSYQIEPFITHMFMQWGQLVNHDITSLSINGDGENNICEPCTRSEKCFPIPIIKNASIQCQSLMEHPCIEFKRSTPTFPDIECSIGRREQLNLQTSYLDGSFLYGTSEEDLEKLKDNSLGRGFLAMQTVNGLLPQSKEENPSDCIEFKKSQKCFMAGDERVNQNPGLMSLHTIFAREHNRIAAILGGMNHLWSDKTVFEETRRVIIAFFQHITYNEYVPILLGKSIAKEFKLTPGKGKSQFSFYDASIDPRISNEWAAAAGRFGHSMIRGQYSRLDKDYTAAGSNSMYLRNSYFRANSLYDQCQGGMEAVVRGLLKDPIMKVDRFFTTDITQHLFEMHDRLGRSFHFDLVTINLQRGRDHGIPGYNKFREFCNLPTAKTWSDLEALMPEDVVAVFKNFYKSVDDIDLFSALVAEHKQGNALVGPTLVCLLGTQFRDLKFGDRFWYETKDLPGKFTPEQLREIRKITLSKLLCRNMKDTPTVQPFAMVSSDLNENKMVNCKDLGDLNWLLWKA